MSKDEDDDILHLPVTELIAVFREGLIALVPIADRLKMGWRDDQHRDWENLAEAVYNSCVRGPIDADEGREVKELPLCRYDIDETDYGKSSWIALDRLDGLPPAVLVRLLTTHEPFDSVECVILDPDSLTPVGRTKVSVADSDFVFVRRMASGASRVVRQIEAVE